MSRSSSACLSFGIAFEEDFKFPWSDRNKYDDGITDWWKEVNNYIEPTIYSYKDEEEWLKANPVPIKTIKCCSYDYPIYILATKDMSVEWAETLKLDLQQLAANIEQDSKIIIDFLNKYNIKYEGSPSWILSSFYG